ncbi:MAG: hypothetical protein V5A44_09670 [Haloarculaceae archaeon]
MPDETESGVPTGTAVETEAETQSDAGIDVGRLGRTLALIGFVTAVFILLTANRLSGDLVQVGFVAIGTVAFITAVVGFFIAAGDAIED